MNEPRTLWGIPIMESDDQLIGDGSITGDLTFTGFGPFGTSKRPGIRTRFATWLRRLARRRDCPDFIVHRPVYFVEPREDS